MIYVGNSDGPSSPFDASKYEEVCLKMCHQQSNGRKRFYSCRNKPSGRHVALYRSTGIPNPMRIQLCEVEVFSDLAEGKNYQILYT